MCTVREKDSRNYRWPADAWAHGLGYLVTWDWGLGAQGYGMTSSMPSPLWESLKLSLSNKFWSTSHYRFYGNDQLWSAVSVVYKKYVSTRHVWTEEVTKQYLSLIHERNITAILDDKQQRNATIYQGFNKEILAHGQTLTQWFMSAKSEMSQSGASGNNRIHFKFCNDMDRIWLL